MYNLYKYPFPPQNYIAEELLLGIILIYPEILPYIIPFIKSEYFFLESHRAIYLHLSTIYKNTKLYNIELFYYLSDTKILSQIGGINKIIDLMKQGHIFISNAEINIYIKELIEIINFNYIKRIMIQYGQNIIHLAYIKKISNYKLYNKASAYLNFTEQKISTNNSNNYKDLISDLLINIKYNKTIQYKINKSHIESGFQELDKIILGLPRGELIIIAGRPSMGKTSFAINLLCNILKKPKTGFCFFSLEMTSQQILYKVLSIYSNIPIQDIYSNQLNNIEYNKIKNICKKLLNNYLYINDEQNTSIDYIEYISKILYKEYNNIKIIIIDYLQLIQTDDSYLNNRVQELSYITRKLKLLAQYLNIPVIALSQLNRSIESRNNKKPLLSDLKESGCINFQEDIKIKKNIDTSIFIKNIIKNNNCISYVYKENTINYDKQKSYIYLFTEYLFIIYINDIIYLQTTYNHQYIVYKKWTNIYNFIENNSLKNFSIQYYSLLNYLKIITFYQYSTVYDIHIRKYFNFICKNFILHNSIEQDADIIIMLFQKEKDETVKEVYYYKTIDINISKNRNGPIGSFQLYFKKDTTQFKSINKKVFN